MIKNIITNNAYKCNSEAMYKSLELQIVNFVNRMNAINNENVKRAKDKIKENSQFCIINPISIKSVQKGCDN